MRWNLRLTAARRGIWKATDLRQRLADNGLVMSVGKMSALWSGDPVSIKLADLEIICTTLGCGVAELLVAEPLQPGEGRVATAIMQPPPGIRAAVR